MSPTAEALPCSFSCTLCTPFWTRSLGAQTRLEHSVTATPNHQSQARQHMRKRSRDDCSEEAAAEERPAKNSRKDPVATFEHAEGAGAFTLTLSGVRSQLRLRNVDGAKWKAGVWCVTTAYLRRGGRS